MGKIVKCFKLSRKYKLNRSLDEEEIRNQLFYEHDDGNTDAYNALIAFNSTYTEYVDNSFEQRGDAADFVGCFVAIVLFSTTILMFFYSLIDYSDLRVPLFFVGIFTLFCSYLCYIMVVKHEFFTYTHFPVRFNRRNRKIYIFRHNGDNGVLVVPWGEGFYHRGQNMKRVDKLNLRCHLMDGDLIKDTFDVGSPSFAAIEVDETWQFIWRYMEEGVKSVKPPFISLTTNGNWKSCWVFSISRIFVLPFILRFILLPITILQTFVRWLGLAVCKKPVWPEWVEKECQIDSNDPHVLSTPSYAGEPFDADTPEARAILEKYRKERAEAEAEDFFKK